MILDDGPMVDDPHPTKLSGTQLASSWGLNIINNLREAHDVLHKMTIEFESERPFGETSHLQGRRQS